MIRAFIRWWRPRLNGYHGRTVAAWGGVRKAYRTTYPVEKRT